MAVTSDTPDRFADSEHGIFQPARKQVTVLFCDVVDYTSRAVSLDPEDLAGEIRAFQALCAGVAEKYHGHIASYLGDGLLVLFGHPVASEFDPEHAVRAGMEMVKGIQSDNASTDWCGREPIRIRVGIATGLVVVGKRAAAGRHKEKSDGELIFGEAPNLAARLQGLAEPNSVVVALRTRRLVGGAFEFRDLGTQAVKGFAQPVSAWQILRESTFQNRSTTSLKRVTTRFVGRWAELQRLREDCDLAFGGRRRIVHLSGEPGIGKSRLVRAFEKTLRKRAFHRLRVACSPYFCNSPFKPIVDETHRWLQIGEQDGVEARRRNIHRAMIAIDLDQGHEHALFDELLGIPPAPGRPRLAVSAEEKHHRTVDALAAFVIRLSKLRPLLLVVEDLHWADPSTLEVLGAIVSGSRAETLFAVFTSRTGFTPPWPTPPCMEMKLGGLDDECSARLIAAVSGARALPEEIKTTLIRKSGGVPLFLEETSRHLLGQMRPDEVRDGEGVYRAFAVPDTLQDSLNARLDQLGEAKAFAQLAAAFSGAFRYSAISKVAAQNGIDADAGMDVLRAAGLLAVISDADDAEDRYVFRHILFQEAAHQSLLNKTRQRYHLQIVELLEQEDPGVARRHPELIAHHYSHTARLDRAVDLWRKAGEQAIAQSAVSEALRHLSQGLELVAKLPEGAARDARELALLLNLGVALTARSGYHGEQVTRTYQRALALAEAAGGKHRRDDNPQAWTALYGLWRCLVCRAAFSKSVRVAVKLKSLSEKSGDPKRMMTAWGLQGMIRMVVGRFASAEGFYDKAVKLYDRSRDRDMGVRFGQDPYVTIRGLGAVNKLLLNKIPQSLAESDQSVEAAHAIGHPYTVAETLRVAAMHRQIAGDHAQLGALAENTVALAEDYGFEGLLAAGNIFLAFRRAMQSGAGDEVDLIRDNLQRYEDNYGLLFLPYFHGVRAEACLFLGAYADALSTAEGALAMIDRFGETWWRPHLLGIKAAAAARGGLASEAEIHAWRRTAMQTAKTQQAEFIHERLQIWPPR